MSRPLRSRLNLPYRRHTISAASSREALFSSSCSSNASSLSHLSKKPATVNCPYCHNITTTRVRQSDSKTTKAVHAVLWAGMADPFALTTFDWFQDVDHYCSRCGGHLVRKPYRRATEVIPEEDVLSLVEAKEERQELFVPGKTMSTDANSTAENTIPTSLKRQRLDRIHPQDSYAAYTTAPQATQQRTPRVWPRVVQHNLELEASAQQEKYSQESQQTNSVHEVNMVAA